MNSPTRNVGGVVWTSRRFGRWTATAQGHDLQIDAVSVRSVRTGWAVSVDGRYATQCRSMEHAMRHAALLASAA